MLVGMDPTQGVTTQQHDLCQQLDYSDELCSVLVAYWQVGGP